MKKYKVVGQCFTLQEGDKVNGKAITKSQVIVADDVFETERDMSGKAVIEVATKKVEDNAGAVD